MKEAREAHEAHEAKKKKLKEQMEATYISSELTSLASSAANSGQNSGDNSGTSTPMPSAAPASTKYLMSTPDVGALLADLALEKRSTMVQKLGCFDKLRASAGSPPPGGFDMTAADIADLKASAEMAARRACECDSPSPKENPILQLADAY